MITLKFLIFLISICQDSICALKEISKNIFAGLQVRLSRIKTNTLVPSDQCTYHSWSGSCCVVISKAVQVQNSREGYILSASNTAVTLWKINTTSIRWHSPCCKWNLGIFGPSITFACILVPLTFSFRAEEVTLTLLTVDALGVVLHKGKK